MIQILYGSGHDARCRVLQGVTPGSSVANANGPALDKHAQKIDTLVFWGHGNSSGFCDMNPSAFVEKVKEWKKWNPTIKTIEIITCNSRHGGEAVDTSKTFKDHELPWVKSYTDRIKPQLQKLGLTIKALPLGMGAHVENRWSILMWSKATNTWLYITAGGGNDTDGMWEAVYKVQLHQLYKTTKNWATAGATVKAAEPMRKFTIDFGNASQLRSFLTKLA